MPITYLARGSFLHSCINFSALSLVKENVAYTKLVRRTFILQFTSFSVALRILNSDESINRLLYCTLIRCRHTRKIQTKYHIILPNSYSVKMQQCVMDYTVNLACYYRLARTHPGLFPDSNYSAGQFYIVYAKCIKELFTCST